MARNATSAGQYVVSRRCLRDHSTAKSGFVEQRHRFDDMAVVH